MSANACSEFILANAPRILATVLRELRKSDVDVAVSCLGCVSSLSRRNNGVQWSLYQLKVPELLVSIMDRFSNDNVTYSSLKAVIALCVESDDAIPLEFIRLGLLDNLQHRLPEFQNNKELLEVCMEVTRLLKACDDRGW